MSRPSRGLYRLTEDDIALGEQLVAAAMENSVAFRARYDAAQLGARRRKEADLHVLLVGVAGVAARLRFPVQRRRPRSEPDIEDLLSRVLAFADPDLLDEALCRRLMHMFVKLDSIYEGASTGLTALYTAAVTCATTVQRSRERSLVMSPNWQSRYRSAAKAFARAGRLKAE